MPKLKAVHHTNSCLAKRVTLKGELPMASAIQAHEGHGVVCKQTAQ